MKSGDINKSTRLQKLLRILSAGGEYSTMGLARATNSCAVHSDVNDLRRNGVDVICKPRYNKRLGKNIWYYRLADKAA